MAPRAGSAPLFPDLAQCLCEKAHWGEMHTCEGPAASCVPVRPCRVFLRSGSKTTGSETSLGTRTGLAVRDRNVSKSAGLSGDGVSNLRGVQLVTARRLSG